jgi:NADPH:quinone reductase-like Zn-dependent oxidoreductase
MEELMKAIAVEHVGDNPRLLDLAKPNAEDKYIVRITKASVNPVDHKLLAKLNPDSSFPFVMGIDFAGTLEKSVLANDSLKVGDRVFGMARTCGSYAQYTAVTPKTNNEPITRIPPSLTDEQASTLPVAGVAALGALRWFELRRGQTLIIFGATGSVGGYATQIASSQGARAIAVVHGETGEARRLGADDAFDAKAGDIFGAIRAKFPDGVDAVLDLVNDKTVIRNNAKLLKAGGRIASTIYSADVDWFKQHNITACNISSDTNPASTSEGLDELAGLMARGVITARIGTRVTLDEFAQRQNNGILPSASGKVVIDVSHSKASEA